MLPLLKLFAGGEQRKITDLTDILADEFALTDEEREKLLPSGQDTVLKNRIGWSRTYLYKTGLIEQIVRGIYKISPLGVEALKQNPTKIDDNFLRQFPEFVNWLNIKREKTNDKQSIGNAADEKTTPEEQLEFSYLILKNTLAIEILDKVKSCSPAFFERLVVELLVKMGYGGTLQDAGKAIGRSGDGGIDGIIKEDRLGLDAIYLQAKRWEGNVSRPEVQKFAGALQGQRARKGVFITTSDFTKDAREYVAFIESKIILINGDELAQLMIDYNVGVSNAAIYEIKKIDSDYFTEE